MGKRLHFHFVFCVLPLLLLLGVAFYFARSSSPFGKYYTEFNGIPWLADISDYPEMVEVDRHRVIRVDSVSEMVEDAGFVVRYMRSGDHALLGNLRADKIVYGFYEGAFRGVVVTGNIAVSEDNASPANGQRSGVWHTLVRIYGPPKKRPYRGEGLLGSDWDFPNLRILYIPDFPTHTQQIRFSYRDTEIPDKMPGRLFVID